MINIILSLIFLWLFSYIFIGLDNLIDELIRYFKRIFIKNYDTRITRSYNVFADIKNSKIRDYYLNIYRFFVKIKEAPEDLYNYSLFSYYRINRGWANSDVWNLHSFLISIIVPMLKKLKKDKNGYPITIISKKYLDKNGNCTNEGDTINKENWDKILDSMILTFTLAKKIDEDHWYYQESTNYSKKLADKYRKLQKELRKEKPEWYDEYFGYVMTKEECKVYEKGFKLFQKYFFNLWD